jgi:hypothetical protein
MLDSNKDLGQAVNQEASDKRYGGDFDRRCADFVSIFGGEGHHAVFKAFFRCTLVKD